ncbi:hypothetical protein [Achromobacter aloeverae]
MKKIAFALAACVAAFFVAGCSTTQVSSARDKIAAACPVMQVAVANVQALGDNLSAKLQEDVAQAAPVIAQVCVGNAAIDTTSIQSLVATTFPALIADVNATSLAAADKAKIVTGLALAQIALTAAVQLQAQVPTPADASTAAPAAPAGAASQ